MTSGRLYDYIYDNRGNQTTRTLPNGPDKAWTQTWDSEDRLTKVEKTKGTEVRTVTFNYDPFGRRIGKAFTIKRGATTLTSNSWSYVYDNEDIVQETFTPTSGPAEKTFFIHGPGIDEPLALVRGGQYYTYHADGLGSIAAIADSTHNVVEHYTYDSYGKPTPQTGFRNSYTYSGRELDKEAGLLYYRARYRDLLDGSFISKDKLGFAAGDVNLWNYVQNNPINSKDPMGLTDAIPIPAPWTWPWEGAGTAARCNPIGLALTIIFGMPTSTSTCADYPPKDACKRKADDKSDECYNRCKHLLPSPSGDLQSSEYRKCFRECMGTLQ